MYPCHSRSGCAKSLSEVTSIENDGKARYYLSYLNSEYFLDPTRNLLKIREVGNLESVRSVRLGDRHDEISACKMIPGRGSALAGDENGNIHYMSLLNGLSEVIDVKKNRGTILDMAFCNETRFMIVGENKECTFNELQGSQIRELVNKFEDSNFVRKIQFLGPDRFIAGESFHNIRLYDSETLTVQRKIPTLGSVYSLARLDSNVFCYGGSNSEVTYHDCRLHRSTMHLRTNENWTGVIRHLDACTVMFSDWRNIVLADLRKGVLRSYRTMAKSGIWDAVVVDAGTLLASSSDCRIVKLRIDRD